MSSSKKASQALPAHLEERRSTVSIGPETPAHTSTYEFSGLFNSLGFDNSFNLANFQSGLKIKNMWVSEDENEAVFDIIGIDAPIANAIRRIMLSEIPTMAFEKVYIFNNTGLMQDEVLAHRLGLIPIKADAEQFDDPDPDVVTDRNTLVFTLDVTCRKDEATGKIINEKVFSRDLVWKPQGAQGDLGGELIKPVLDDILITKLRPGQTIDLEARCDKGIGRTHAKWSPVATISYRLMPKIELRQDVVGEEAKELVALCPLKVFDIEDLGKKGEGGKAVVKNPRACSMCRECIREEKWQSKVKLGRAKDHFIFSIESTGIYPATSIFIKAVDKLIDKCTKLEEKMEEIQNSFSSLEQDD